MVDTPAIKFENISKTFQTADNEILKSNPVKYLELSAFLEQGKVH